MHVAGDLLTFFRRGARREPVDESDVLDQRQQAIDDLEQELDVGRSQASSRRRQKESPDRAAAAQHRHGDERIRREPLREGVGLGAIDRGRPAADHVVLLDAGTEQRLRCWARMDHRVLGRHREQQPGQLRRQWILVPGALGVGAARAAQPDFAVALVGEHEQAVVGVAEFSEPLEARRDRAVGAQPRVRETADLLQQREAPPQQRLEAAAGRDRESDHEQRHRAEQQSIDFEPGFAARLEESDRGAGERRTERRRHAGRETRAERGDQDREEEEHEEETARAAGQGKQDEQPRDVAPGFPTPPQRTRDAHAQAAQVEQQTRGGVGAQDRIGGRRVPLRLGRGDRHDGHRGRGEQQAQRRDRALFGGRGRRPGRRRRSQRHGRSIRQGSSARAGRAASANGASLRRDPLARLEPDRDLAAAGGTDRTQQRFGPTVLREGEVVDARDGLRILDHHGRERLGRIPTPDLDWRGSHAAEATRSCCPPRCVATRNHRRRRPRAGSRVRPRRRRCGGPRPRRVRPSRRRAPRARS